MPKLQFVRELRQCHRQYKSLKCAFLSSPSAAISLSTSLRFSFFTCNDKRGFYNVHGTASQSRKGRALGEEQNSEKWKEKEGEHWKKPGWNKQPAHRGPGMSLSYWHSPAAANMSQGVMGKLCSELLLCINLLLITATLFSASLYRYGELNCLASSAIDSGFEIIHFDLLPVLGLHD